ncbi:GNAT family N-acetyltransferase [Jiulongibacter sp. NS-SX5]|uniref:GNAT family N-acetyltransferase n=1 Tax=Jiulongibacter sp. NS-SX5 TaxID=3463854 RepID=UPI0040595412
MKTYIREIKKEEVWPLRHEVMWPDKPFEYVKVANDADGKHFGLFENENLVSVVSLFMENGSAQFRKLATKVSAQRKGYASELIARLIQEAKGNGADKIWCNARGNKTGYYEKFGLKKTDQTFQKGGLDYVIMEMRL